jgi:hypothetical protein
MKTRDIPFTYTAFFKDFKDIVRNHGVLNLWRGNIMNVAKVFPYAAVVKIEIFRILLVLIF